MVKQLSRRNFLKLGLATGAALAAQVALRPGLIPAMAQSDVELASHVTIGNSSIQANLNPFGFIYFQARQVYDTLIDISADGQLMPGLATEWNRVDDQTLEIKLRDDVFFSNGERFTANSVKFTLDFLMSQMGENFFAFYVPITDLMLTPPTPLLDANSIEVIDDTNLLVRVNRPDAILERRLSRLFILSEEHLTANGGDMTSTAVGTGYLKIAEFAPGERVEYETWEGNWRGSLPIQTATYVRVGDLRTALESGDIDVAQSMPPNIARTMAESGEWGLSTNPALATDIIDFLPNTHPALQDVRVRRALNLAVNKQEYSDVIMAGFAQPTTGQLLSPEFDGYNPTLEGFAYDPDEARRLLEEAGYADLQLSMLAPNTSRAEAEALVGYYQAIGVDITLETPDSNAVIQEVYAGTDYNLIYWESNYVTLGDWSQAMIPFTVSANVQRHFDNDEFFELNDRIAAASSPETRNPLIEEIAQLMYDEAAAVFLAWKTFYYVHTPRIESLPFHLDTAPRIEAIRMRLA